MFDFFRVMTALFGVAAAVAGLYWRFQHDSIAWGILVGVGVSVMVHSLFYLQIEIRRWRWTPLVIGAAGASVYSNVAPWLFGADSYRHFAGDLFLFFIPYTVFWVFFGRLIGEERGKRERTVVKTG